MRSILMLMDKTDFDRLDRQIQAIINAYTNLKRDHSTLLKECEQLRHKKQQVRDGIVLLVQQLKEVDGTQ